MTTRNFIGALIGVMIAAAIAAAQPSRVDMQRELNELVIEAANDATVAPIPVVVNGRMHAAVYDPFMLGIVSHGARVAAGSTPTAEGAPLTVPLIVVVAYPIECDGRRNTPRDVRMTVSGRPAPVPKMEPGRGPQLLRGVQLPANALITTFQEMPLRDALVEVDYADTTCLSESKTVSARLVHTLTRPRRFPVVAKLPDDAASLPSPTVVRVRLTVDRAGAVRFAAITDGPPALANAAVAAMNQVTFEPAQVNGVARHTTIIMPVTFTATGAPPARGAAPPVAPEGAPPIAGSPGAAAKPPSAPGVMTTPDVRDLTEASSRCAIATDETYGITATQPIRIGGVAAQGAVREQQYIAALRGPAGQGLRYRRVGSILGPDRTTVLGVYEISYSGLKAPLSIYFDRSQLGELKAPKGFTCAVPLDIKAPSPTH